MDLFRAYHYEVGGGSETVYAAGDTGGIDSYDTTYLTARSGGGTFVVDEATTNHEVGQKFDDPTYHCYITYLDFLLPAAPGGFKTAALSLAPAGDWWTTESVIEAKLYDWGSSLTSADWVAGADWDSTGTLAATLDTATSWGASNVYMPFTSEAAFPGLLTPGANNRFILASERFADGDTPTGNEWGWLRLSADPDYYPKLEVTW